MLINNLLNEFNNLDKSEKIKDDFIIDVRYRVVINDSLIFCIDDFGRTLINSNYACELKMFNNIKQYIDNKKNFTIIADEEFRDLANNLELPDCMYGSAVPEKEFFIRQSNE